jgi:hypothetical protein
VLDLLFGALILRYDVLVSAGHEGRPASCAHFPQHHCNLGAQGERTWTPIVADAATKTLRRYGITVARLPADFAGKYQAGVAVFIHFDGSAPPCGSRASVGYADKSDAAAARAWRALYGAYWPFGFQQDNFTDNLSAYYAFKQVDALNGSLVLELGEITCPSQHAWLAPRLHWIGELLAYFLSRQIDDRRVPDPGSYRE